MKKAKPTKDKSKSNLYTATEVGTLLESMDKKIDLVLEGHVGLDKGLEKLEVEVHGNSRRLDFLEVRVSVIDGKVTHLEDAVSKLSKDLKETREELKSEIQKIDSRLDAVELSRG